MNASRRKHSGKPEEEKQFWSLSEVKHRTPFKVTLLENYFVTVIKEVLKKSFKRVIKRQMFVFNLHCVNYGRQKSLSQSKNKSQKGLKSFWEQLNL